MLVTYDKNKLSMGIYVNVIISVFSCDDSEISRIEKQNQKNQQKKETK